jgi:5-methylcytosine-specific restriction endonuclease McrA
VGCVQIETIRATSHFKQCSKCKWIKPIGEFHKGEKYKGGIRSQCKKCAHKQVGEWQKNNPDKVKESRQKSWENHREERNTKRRKRPIDWQPMTKAEISQRYYQRHRDEVRERSKTWNIDPIKVKIKKYRRRAREYNAQGYATAEQIKSRIKMFGGKCWICGKDYQEIDHVIALSRGGSNWPANLRPICKSCNSGKQGRDWRIYTSNLQIQSS